MSRGRYWLHLSFWLPFPSTLALMLIGAQTRGDVTDDDGATPHLVAMAMSLMPLAWIVGARAHDAGASAWVSVLSVVAAGALFPFSLLLLGLLHTSARRRTSTALSPWWIVPVFLASIGLATLLSLVMR